MLDFDTENRPLTYVGSDFTFGELTAIAACWADTPRKPKCWLLGDTTQPEMLAGFLELYEQAGIVTGHNLVKHDLPRVNASLVEAGMPPLKPKLVSDTYRDLVKWADLSKAQGALGEMLGLAADKYDMSQQKWRDANRLTPKGLAETRKRVVTDVRQHIQLRAALLERGLLKPPKVWAP